MKKIGLCSPLSASIRLGSPRHRTVDLPCEENPRPVNIGIMI